MSIINELMENMEEILKGKWVLMNLSEEAFICVMCATLDTYAEMHGLDSVDMAGYIYEAVKDANEAEGQMKVF